MSIIKNICSKLKKDLSFLLLDRVPVNKEEVKTKEFSYEHPLLTIRDALCARLNINPQKIKPVRFNNDYSIFLPTGKTLYAVAKDLAECCKESYTGNEVPVEVGPEDPEHSMIRVGAKFPDFSLTTEVVKQTEGLFLLHFYGKQEDKSYTPKAA